MKKTFFAILATIMVPFQTIMLPVYIITLKLQLINCIFYNDGNFEQIKEVAQYCKDADILLYFTVNKNHPLAKKSVISIKDLKGVPIILMKEDCLQPILVQKAFEKMLADA